MAEEGMVFLNAWQARSLATVLRELVPESEEVDGVTVTLRGADYEVVVIPSMKKALVGPTGAVELVERF